MSSCPVVDTCLGKAKGRLCAKPKPAYSKQVYNYAGIPFAKPPIDELRFEPPIKYANTLLNKINYITLKKQIKFVLRLKKRCKIYNNSS